MRKAVIVPLLLITAITLSAQLRTGQIHGRITDKDGHPLRGVKVTLSGPPARPLTAVTGEAGIYRFLSVHPASGYAVKAELEGYKPTLWPKVAVAAGVVSKLDLTLEAGKVEEQKLVSAAPPALDARKTTTLWTANLDMLRELPTARDPWAILQLAPAVLLDRENVGGSESGQQASFVAKGDRRNGANNVWAVDGTDITDPASLGESPFFYDFDSFAEIAVSAGGASDVALQSGGITLNMVTRRGGDRVGASVRFYLADRALQADNMTDQLRAQGIVGTNKIESIKDFGANAGGPLFKGRIRWWAGFGTQDLFLYTIFNTRDQSLLSNYSFKLNVYPFAGNNFEALAALGGKAVYGLNAAPAKPEGDHLLGRNRWGSPLLMVRDEQTFGNNLYLSAKYTRMTGGFFRRPMVDENSANPVVWDVANQVYVPFSSAYERSWDWQTVEQPRKTIQFSGALFREARHNVSHEFKAGLEISSRESKSRWGYRQNFEVRRNFGAPLIDLGEGLVVPPAEWQYIRFGRESREYALAEQTSAYLQDTLAKGRLTLTLGLRFDRQRPSTGAHPLETVKFGNEAWSAVFDNNLMYVLNSRLPSIAVRAIKPKYAWNTWSPRLGLTWDIRGDGKTLARLAVSQYGDIMAVGAYTPRPLGTGGGMGFWWKNADTDAVADLNEVYWQYSSAHPEHPNELYNLYTEAGALTDAAQAALVGGFSSDAYLAGNYWDFDWANPSAVDYDTLMTFYRSDVDPDVRNVKTSPRTTEVLVGLEKEFGPNLAFSVSATYRRTDNFDWVKLFYPADIYPQTPDLVIDDSQTWYTVAGVVPPIVTIGGVVYDTKDAAMGFWYLPNSSFPGETPFRMVDKSKAYNTYIGLDFAVTKRLSKHWLMNASLTFQDQRAHWGGSFIDPTNRWVMDGKPYGNWAAGPAGKSAVQMYSRWLFKASGLYQLPAGFSVSSTFIAREGWKIPHYVTLAYSGDDPWPGLYKANTVYLQSPTKDSLPVFYNLTLRLEKNIKIGSGRMYLMADIFNVLNSTTFSRAFDAYLGTYYVNTGESVANPYNRLYSEILNPRVTRLGLRFEF